MVRTVPGADRLGRQGRSKEREAAMEETLTSLVRRYFLYEGDSREAVCVVIVQGGVDGR